MFFTPLGGSGGCFFKEYAGNASEAVPDVLFELTGIWKNPSDYDKIQMG